MCPVGITDKESHVMLFSLVDFLMILELNFEPYFSVFMIYEIVCDVSKLVIISKKRWRVEKWFENIYVIEILLEVRLESEVHFSCVFLVKDFQCFIMFHDCEVENTKWSICVIGETIIILFNLATTVTTVTWDCISIITLFWDCNDFVATLFNASQVWLSEVRNISWQTLTCERCQVQILW